MALNTKNNGAEVIPLQAPASEVAVGEDDHHDVPLINLQLHPIQSYLNDPTVTEVVINETGVVWVESHSGWKRIESEDISLNWVKSIVKQIANAAGKSVGQQTPFLSARLPSGERVQAVVPGAVHPGRTSITIRRPSTLVKTFQSFIDDGWFAKTKIVQSSLLSPAERAEIESQLPEEDQEMLRLLRDRDFPAFFKKAIASYKNIIISGATGSGKTTLANSFIELIPPMDRIITAEDTPEMRFPPERNVVNMFFDNSSTSVVSPKMVFESTLRMRPDRVLPAELRGDETYFFVQNVLNSGHPGTITTAHANSAKLLFMRISLMIKTSPEGAGLGREDILAMLYMLLDVVVQAKKVNGVRQITEVYYDPAFAAKQMG